MTKTRIMLLALIGFVSWNQVADAALSAITVRKNPDIVAQLIYGEGKRYKEFDECYAHYIKNGDYEAESCTASVDIINNTLRSHNMSRLRPQDMKIALHIIELVIRKWSE